MQLPPCTEPELAEKANTKERSHPRNNRDAKNPKELKTQMKNSTQIIERKKMLSTSKFS